jgi:putative Holliday junction resolvase
MFLGIDYGEKRIGLATGDLETRIASPFMILENNGDDFVLKEIKKICEGEKIEKIIVGLPLTLEAKKGEQANEVLNFIDFLKNNIPIPVEIEDERMTSVMVDKLDGARRGRKERDAVSAMIILQSYFDHVQSTGSLKTQ